MSSQTLAYIPVGQLPAGGSPVHAAIEPLGGRRWNRNRSAPRRPLVSYWCLILGWTERFFNLTGNYRYLSSE